MIIKSIHNFHAWRFEASASSPPLHSASVRLGDKGVSTAVLVWESRVIRHAGLTRSRHASHAERRLLPAFHAQLSSITTHSYSSAGHVCSFHQPQALHCKCYHRSRSTTREERTQVSLSFPWRHENVHIKEEQWYQSYQRRAPCDLVPRGLQINDPPKFWSGQSDVTARRGRPQGGGQVSGHGHSPSQGLTALCLFLSSCCPSARSSQ